MARADKLTQSILAKAFRGELVPTEAALALRERRDYEPASKLLEPDQGRAAARSEETESSEESKLMSRRNSLIESNAQIRVWEAPGAPLGGRIDR